MHLSNHSVKHRSLGVWPAILTAVSFFAASSLATGCVIVDDDDDGDHQNHPGEDPRDPPVEPDPTLFSIDTDQTLQAEPGEGVGLFVEYAAGGTWRLWTTCDTNYSNVGCKFDVFASVDTSSEMSSVEGIDFEGFDAVEMLEEGVAHFHAETASDIDVLQITTTPGAILRVELDLDGSSGARFIYWVGDGVVHEGAPISPVDLEPTAP